MGWRVTSIIANALAALRAGFNTFTKAQVVAKADLVDNVLGIVVDATAANMFLVPLGVVAGNTRQLKDPVGLVAGGIYHFVFTQPGGGGEAVTYGALYAAPGGVFPVVAAGASAVSYIKCVYDGTALHIVSAALDLQ